MSTMSIKSLARGRALALCLALPCLDAAAQQKDSLASVECKQALAALQAQEMVVADTPGDKASPPYRQAFAELQARRSKAAIDCLGGRMEAAVPPRSVVRAPVAVDPVNPGLSRGGLSGAAKPSSQVAAPATPPAPSRSTTEPLRSVTACDAAGCWASDGSRLQRLGPNLVGPRGVCTVQGAVLNCP
jgi:hypothetical protein